MFFKKAKPTLVSSPPPPSPSTSLPPLTPSPSTALPPPTPSTPTSPLPSQTIKPSNTPTEPPSKSKLDAYFESLPPLPPPPTLSPTTFLSQNPASSTCISYFAEAPEKSHVLPSKSSTSPQIQKDLDRSLESRAREKARRDEKARRAKILLEGFTQKALRTKIVQRKGDWEGERVGSNYAKEFERSVGSLLEDEKERKRIGVEGLGELVVRAVGRGGGGEAVGMEWGGWEEGEEEREEREEREEKEWEARCRFITSALKTTKKRRI